MKNGLFLLAITMLSSALYAQQPLTYQATEELFARYNPQLMQRATQAAEVRSLVQQVIAAYLSQQPLDTLENRYTLIALARNFENSLLLQTITEQYQQAAWYAQVGNPAVLIPAREQAHQNLIDTYARIWAVSVQVKEDLLAQYKQARRETARDVNFTRAEQKARTARLDHTIHALQADIRQLRTQPGRQLIELADAALTKVDEQVRAQKAQLEAVSSDNLQIKTKHKKPVAE